MWAERSCCIGILGSKDIGKTSLINRLVTNQFQDSALEHQRVQCSEHVCTMFTFCNRHGETARFLEEEADGSNGAAKEMVVERLSECDAVIFAFDATNADSFYILYQWIPLIKREDGVKVLVALRRDLVDEGGARRSIPHDQSLKLATSYKMNIYMECSAKVDANLNHLKSKIWLWKYALAFHMDEDFLCFVQDDVTHVQKNLDKFRAFDYDDDDNDEYEYGPLFIAAAATSRYDIIRMLVSALPPNKISSISKNGKTPLHFAVQSGNVDIVNELVKSKLDSNAADETGLTPLHVAVMNRNLSVAKALLTNAQTDPNIQQKNGKMPLLMAADVGDVKMISLLVTHKANPNITTKEGYTPIFVAAQNNHPFAIDELISCKANIDSPDPKKSPAYIAVRNGHLESLQLLLQHKADTSILVDNTGNTLLHVATMNDLCIVDIIEALGNSMTDSCIRNKQGDTPIHIAAKQGHFQAVKKLLQLKSDPDVLNKDGHTPIFIAAKNDNPDIIKELITHSGDPNTADQNELTPLGEAASKGFILSVLALLEQGADVNIPNYDGKTPLHLASESGHAKIVRKLLSYGADMESTDNDGCTSLLIATQKNRVGALKELLMHGANENATNNKEQTPIQIAVANGFVEVITELALQPKIDLNVLDDDGLTPIHVAALQNDEKCIAELIFHRANPNITTSDGWGPIHLAAQEGHVKAVRALVNHGANPSLKITCSE